MTLFANTGVLKPECYECKYWDKKARHHYKCYTSRCPAKVRDDYKERNLQLTRRATYDPKG